MAARVLIAYLILCVVLSYGDCRPPSPISIAEQQYQIELEKRLETLNKPPVKTIISKVTGHVLDCVPINDQPAFDHPTLKNHKIQSLPTFSPQFIKSGSKNRKISVKLRNTEEACPDGTVPIKRTTKEDLIQSDKELLDLKDHEALSKKVTLRLENHGKLHGSDFNMALYNLSIGDDQESSAEVRLEAGPPGQADVLSVGWKVSHDLNGDGFTRSFGFWHDGTNNKGCYNTLCPGFVQVDKEFPINCLFDQTSVYGNADEQYGVFMRVLKDPKNGDWWLIGGNDRVIIGYWPKELFPNLVNGADLITWGGAASPGTNGDYPPMGNGHLPNGLYKDTCFFDSVRYVDSADQFIVPQQADTTISVDSPGCYDLGFAEPHERLQISSLSFMFGGPGGNECSN